MADDVSPISPGGPEGAPSLPSVEAPSIDTAAVVAPVAPEVAAADVLAAIPDTHAAIETAAAAPTPDSGAPHDHPFTGTGTEGLPDAWKNQLGSPVSSPDATSGVISKGPATADLGTNGAHGPVVDTGLGTEPGTDVMGAPLDGTRRPNMTGEEKAASAEPALAPEPETAPVNPVVEPMEPPAADAAAAGEQVAPGTEHDRIIYKGFSSEEIARDEELSGRDLSSLTDSEKEELAGFEKRREENAFQNLEDRIARGETLSEDEQVGYDLIKAEKEFNSSRPADAKVGETFEQYRDRKASEGSTDGEAPKDGTEGREKKKRTRKPKTEADTNPKTEKPVDPVKAKRIEELEEKIKAGTATKDEIREHRELKKDPEARREALKQKALDGTITDEELDELMAKPEEQKTPEQLAKEMEDEGTQMMLDAIAGKDITLDRLEAFRKMRGEQDMIKQGFTPEQARAAMREVLKRSPGDRERQSAVLKELKDKIQKLMTLEYQILTVPKTVDSLRNQRKGIQDQAKAAHTAAENATSEADRLTKKTREYDLYMQIANINTAIIGAASQVPILDAERRDLEQYIRRKVGVTSLLSVGGFLEFSGAKVNNVVTGVRVDVSNEINYRLGRY